MRFIGAKQAGILSALAFVSVAMNVFVLQGGSRNAVPNVGNLAEPPSAAVADSRHARPIEPPGTPSAPRVIAKVAPPTLSTAELVRSVQRELNERNYATGRPDGVVGMMTRAGIMAFEQDYGLPLTAEPSEDLLSRIVLGVAASPASASARELKPATKAAADLIRHVKKQLSALGYATGGRNGDLTDEFAAAIRGFEGRNGLAVTGRITAPLVSKLAARYAATQTAQSNPR